MGNDLEGIGSIHQNNKYIQSQKEDNHAPWTLLKETRPRKVQIGETNPPTVPVVLKDIIFPEMPKEELKRCYLKIFDDC